MKEIAIGVFMIVIFAPQFFGVIAPRFLSLPTFRFAVAVGQVICVVVMYSGLPERIIWIGGPILLLLAAHNFWLGLRLRDQEPTIAVRR